MVKVRQVHITHTYPNRCRYMPTHMYIHTQAYIHEYMCTYIHKYIDTHIYTHAYIHMHTYTHVHIHTHIYVYIHTHKQVSKLLSKYFQFQEFLNLELSIQNTYRGIHFFGGSSNQRPVYA